MAAHLQSTFLELVNLLVNHRMGVSYALKGIKEWETKSATDYIRGYHPL